MKSLAAALFLVISLPALAAPGSSIRALQVTVESGNTRIFSINKENNGGFSATTTFCKGRELTDNEKPKTKTFLPAQYNSILQNVFASQAVFYSRINVIATLATPELVLGVQLTNSGDVIPKPIEIRDPLVIVGNEFLNLDAIKNFAQVAGDSVCK